MLRACPVDLIFMGVIFSGAFFQTKISIISGHKIRQGFKRVGEGKALRQINVLTFETKISFYLWLPIPGNLIKMLKHKILHLPNQLYSTC